MTNDSQQLRESMWDFVYGLLSEAESQSLVARIKSEPDVARLYAEVQLQADLVSRASRVEDSSIALSATAAASPSAAKQGKPQPAAGRSVMRPTKADSYRGGAWLAGIGVTALTALLAVGFFWPRSGQRQLAHNFVAADVTASQPIQAGLTNKLALRSYLVSSSSEPKEGTPASVELRFVDRTGQERYRKTVNTGDNGEASVEVPGNVLEPGVRLELAATLAPQGGLAAKLADQQETASHSGVTSSELPIEPEPKVAYLLLAEPQQPSGKSVPFAVWDFGAFSATPDSSEASLSVTSALPGLAIAPTRTLEDRLDTPAQSATAPTKDAVRIVSAAEPVTVAIPEQLAGKPLTVAAIYRGATVATVNIEVSSPAPASNGGKTTPSSNEVSLELPPEADGLIEIAFFDRSLGDTAPLYRELVHRVPARKLEIDLPDLQQRYEPGQEVELALQVKDERGAPAANTRVGVRVWNERVIRQSDEQPVLLADSVHSNTGTMARGLEAGLQRSQRGERAPVESYRFKRREGALKDAGETLREEAKFVIATAPAGPIELASNREAVQAAFREAVAQSHDTRQRTIKMIGGAAIFGGIVLLVLMGILAVLRMSAGIKAVAPALIAAAASLFVGLAWIGWLPQSSLKQIALVPAESATASTPPGTADDAANKPQADAMQPNTVLRREPAELAGAPSESMPARGPALASTPAAPPPAAQPADVSLRALQPDSRQAGGGAQAANAGAAPALARQPSSLAPGSAGAFSAGRAASADAGLAPRAQLRARTASEPDAKEIRDELVDKKSEAAAAPPALYFNPQLMTDAEGRATIRFMMPPVDSEYRVLIDALGQGRIGSRQALIVGSDTPQAAK